MIEKRGYIKFGIIGGIIFLFLLFLLEYLAISVSSAGATAILVWGGIYPGTLILRLFTNADPVFFGLLVALWIAILFWFVIGFLLGMLVYKLYLIKNE